jgi:hypothetical protein
MKKYFLILSAFVLFLSCEKQAGEGGTSTIKGVVIVHEWNSDFTIPRDTFPAQDEDVYIVYGDDEVYGDKFSTGYDGKYEFNYLQNGKYTIYVLSKSDTILLTKELIPIIKEVEITDKNQEVVVDTIYIKK